MIQSMTGYGKAELNLKNTNFNIEIKSLNSKQIDISIKMSSIYRGQEINLRKLLAEQLHRGKIELFVWRESSESNPKYNFNLPLIKKYYQQILSLKKDLGLKWNIWTMTPFLAKTTDIMPVLLRMPDVIQKEKEKINESEWIDISRSIDQAIKNLVQFRLEEGKKIGEDIFNRINIIAQYLDDIIPFAKDRINKIKVNLNNKLNELDAQKIDANRFEQELLYYLEKQDITEEQVRLESHLDYFKKIMQTTSPNGKKLAFVAQEIGREINTIGSKSSDAEMQQIVVQMKDELEKIKEQLLNIL
tara:strand:- start:127 stop:1032 length:906 start_codon:yes stop_codon:yes gene_type:complete